MLQNTRIYIPLYESEFYKTMGFKKIMVYEIPHGGGGTPYLASGLFHNAIQECSFKLDKSAK